MVIQTELAARGEIWWLDFGNPLGSDPGYKRPVVIVSSNSFNASRISTVVVTAITSNMALARFPGNVELLAHAAEDLGLDRECVINVTQTLVVDRSRLLKNVGQLSSIKMREVDHGLRLVLSI